MLSLHLKQGRERSIINANQLEKGMIVTFRYQKLDKTSSIYVATVLNPRWPNDSNGKVHALSMKEISYINFQEFAEGFGIRYIPRFQKFKGVDLPKIDMVQASKRIYEGRIKPKLADKLNKSYRTFNIKKMTSLQLLNYDFGPRLNRMLQGMDED